MATGVRSDVVYVDPRGNPITNTDMFFPYDICKTSYGAHFDYILNNDGSVTVPEDPRVDHVMRKRGYIPKNEVR